MVGKLFPLPPIILRCAAARSLWFVCFLSSRTGTSGNSTSGNRSKLPRSWQAASCFRERAALKRETGDGREGKGSAVLLQRGRDAPPSHDAPGRCPRRCHLLRLCRGGEERFPGCVDTVGESCSTATARATVTDRLKSHRWRAVRRPQSSMMTWRARPRRRSPTRSRSVSEHQ